MFTWPCIVEKEIKESDTCSYINILCYAFNTNALHGVFSK